MFQSLFELSSVPSLEVPSVIVMDNAKYHKRKADWVKSGYKMRIAELREYMQQQHLTARPGENCRAEIAKIVARHVRETAPTALQELVGMYGHVVLYTPPHNSDLEPIELIWAQGKHRVAREYDSGTGMLVY